MPQPVVDAALSREIVPDPLGDPLLRQRPGHDGGGDHRVGRCDDRGEEQGHQQRRVQSGPQHAGGDHQHCSHTQPDDDRDPTDVASPVAVRKAQRDAGQTHSQGDPCRLFQQRAGRHAEVFDADQVQSEGPDQHPEGQAQDRSRKRQPLQQGGEERKDDQETGDQCQHHVDVHRYAPSAGAALPQISSRRGCSTLGPPGIRFRSAGTSIRSGLRSPRRQSRHCRYSDRSRGSHPVS